MSHLQILLAPVLTVMGIAFMFNVVLHQFSSSRRKQCAFGVMFGAAIAFGMANPLYLGEGLIFDTRSLLLGAAIAFVGERAGLIALGFGVICRLLIGGVGVVAGVVGLVMAYGLAVAWVRYVHPRIANNLLADASLGLALSPSILALFVLPYETALALAVSVTPTLVTCNVVGMMLLGAVFRRELALMEHRKQLEAQAVRDPLTNLLNRRGLVDAAEQMAEQNGSGRALLYFDVDNFKGINDTYGHGIGDAVLGRIARRIGENLRPGTVFARQGGDEFSVLISDITPADVEQIAKRLCDLISERPMTIQGREIAASISMGAFWTDTDLGLNEMTVKADMQLFLAKEAGKNRASVDCEKAAPPQAVA